MLFAALMVFCLALLALPALASGRGDWWMFQHDPQHTGRSAFTGPGTPGLRWAFTAGFPITSSPAIGMDDTIYVGSADGNLYAINPNGTQKWALATGGSIYYSSPALAADGTVYVGSGSSLFAVNPNGTQKWVVLFSDMIISSPVIAADGTIYVGSMNGRLYALDPNGMQKWNYLTNPYESVWSSPALGLESMSQKKLKLFSGDSLTE